MHTAPLTPDTTPPAQFDLGGMLSTRPSGATCPSCRQELLIGDLEGCQFAGCPECKGMLFQQEVFGTLIQHHRAVSQVPSVTPSPLNTQQLKVRRICPGCEEILETHPYGGPGNAVIDTCFSCRIIWLDGGELTQLVRAPGRR